MITEAELQNMENTDFHRFWSSKSGKLTTLQEVVATIDYKAGQYFSQGEDNLAVAFRNLSKEFKKTETEYSKDLDLIIKEDTRRLKDKEYD